MYLCNTSLQKRFAFGVLLSSFSALDKAFAQVPGVVSTSQLPVLLGAVQEELDNNEWAVRKAASEVLSCMATSVGNTLVSYREGVLTALMNSRFDKVNSLPSLSDFQEFWLHMLTCAF